MGSCGHADSLIGKSLIGKSLIGSGGVGISNEELSTLVSRKTGTVQMSYRRSRCICYR
jgi:hypothetical protein